MGTGTLTGKQSLKFRVNNPINPEEIRCTAGEVQELFKYIVTG